MAEVKNGYEENKITEETETKTTETETAEATETTETAEATETAESIKTAEKDHTKTDPEDAADPKKKWSIFCLLGFGISAITWIVIIIYVIVLTLPNGEFGGNLMGGFFWGSAYYAIPALIAYIASIVLSIIGIIRSRKKKQRGRGFGVWGILISVIGFGINLVTFAGVIGLLVVIGKSLAHYDPYIKYIGELVQYGNYEVKLRADEEERSSEAALMKYYWSGDPKDVEIHLESINNGETEINSIGYFWTAINGPAGTNCENFSIDLAEENKYSGFIPKREYILNPQTHLDDYGIEPGTKVIFDEIEFHVFLGSEVKQVCATYFVVEATPTPKPDVLETEAEKKVAPNYLVLENDDGSVTFYRYHLFFECAEENKRFYADEDGRLCVRSNEDNRWYRVDDSLYRANDGFEPFETVYEGE